MSGAVQSPPKGFASSDLALAQVARGETWRRIFLSKHPDPQSAGFASSRFSDPRRSLPEAERFRVLYLGSSLKVCFLESILRDRGNGRLGALPIAWSELEARLCAEFEVKERLSLVNLCDDGPLQMGIPTDAIRASSHALGQVWSHAFWSHNTSPDGLLYPSRLNGEQNIALYNRALPKMRNTRVVPILEMKQDMAKILREFRLAIV